MKAIYSITNVINNKRYIGKSNFLERRIDNHLRELRNNRHGNKHLQKAWNKYGESNFIIEIIEKIDNENILNDREIFWINAYSSHISKFGYNKTMGGDGGNTNEEIREKISNKLKGENHPLYGKTGKLSPNYGKKHSNETKEKIRKANTGKVISNQTREKLRLINLGKKHTEKTKVKISSSLMGEKNAFYGRRHTEEAKKKIGNKNKGNKNFFGKKHSEETKKKMSEKAIGRVSSFKGKNHSEESRKKLSKSLSGKNAWNKGKETPKNVREKISNNHGLKIRFSNEQIECILNEIINGEKIQNIANNFNCSTKPIFRILNENGISYKDYKHVRDAKKEKTK